MVDSTHRVCLVCGTEFVRATNVGRPPLFCGESCRREAKRNPVPHPPPLKPALPPIAAVRESHRPCGYCGELFPVSPREKDRAKRKWCSRTCGDRARRARQNPLPASATCEHCGVTFVPTRHGAKKCGSYRCRWLMPLSRQCIGCGVELDLEGKWRSQRRCPACSKAAKQATEHRKRVKRRGAKVGAWFTLAEIAERDGYRCHLCGKKVNMALSGMDRQGPSIDHLVPIVDGGKDEPTNVALAHRICNTRRGAGGVAQLRLVG